MTEQELSNCWMAAILEFDWSKEKEDQEKGDSRDENPNRLCVFNNRKKQSNTGVN